MRTWRPSELKLLVWVGVMVSFWDSGKLLKQRVEVRIAVRCGRETDWRAFIEWNCWDNGDDLDKGFEQPHYLF